MNFYPIQLKSTIATFWVAEVGRLLANAKNAFNSFVRRVVATLRQQTFFFALRAKIATKNIVFEHICKYMGTLLLIIFNDKSFIIRVNRNKS